MSSGIEMEMTQERMQVCFENAERPEVNPFWMRTLQGSGWGNYHEINKKVLASGRSTC